MGTFVTDPDEELFDDKTTAPGLVLRGGWTEDNVATADNLNDLRDACYDLRAAHLELAEAVEAGSSVGNATPQPVGSASVGVATAASREDHVHAHGNQLGGSLHAVASGAAAGFMSAADKTKLDANTTDVTLGTANGLSLVGQALSLAVAGGSAGAMSAADKTKLDGLSAAVTPSIQLVTAALPATLNASTEGTIDFFHIYSLTSNPSPFLASANVHRKIRGEGHAFRTFMWFPSPSGGGTVTNGDLDFPVTTSSGDDPSPITGYENGSYIYPSGNATGHGFGFWVLASRTTRVLRVYMGRNACDVTCYAALSDGSTSQTLSIPKASGTPTVFQLGQMVTVTFNAAHEGQWLYIEFKSTTGYASANTVNFTVATLAWS